ncbi:MAG: cellulase family glycosylhydrolase [Alphaproteobacteria bacterium]|nr:cellulase family glycosylhydrolase [Alphaproteobacteria bacterium]
MRRLFLLFLLLAILPLSKAMAADTCIYDASKAPRGERSVTLKRGVNLSRWWEDRRDTSYKSEDIPKLRGQGFDYVRLPLHPVWLTLSDEDEQKDRLAELRCDLVELLNQGLSVIIDLHPGLAGESRLKETPRETMAQVEGIWKNLQPVIKDFPSQRIFLGLYNEPPVESFLWWQMQEQLVNNLRKDFPKNTFVVTTGPHSGWWELILMKPYKDKNLLYDFHFYDPMIVTHHGVEWLPEWRSRTPIVYPVDTKFDFDMDDAKIQEYVMRGWNRATIIEIIGRVEEWRRRSKVRVICTEFGVYRPHIDDQSRYNWLRDVREALEKAGIPWALWEYRGRFGLIDPRGNSDKAMAEALGLGHTDSP